MSEKSPVTHDLTQLFEKIKDVRIAMLTTTDEHGSLHSRPMGTIKPGKDDALYFLTDSESAKVYEIKKDSQVNLSYGDPGSNVYASVSGRANAYRDEAQIAELWSEPMRAWFPKGKEDPHITVLKITIDKAEYWDSPSSFLSQAYGYVRAVVTGERSKDDDVNQHAQVQPQ
ncbi:pyridoxamine 5'-phosphate oxidase family protein [Hymenobacter sp. M29]|uniref:Pyridoxamine 5'-phosphate oxidase family protein n=1 Tax=Hymenobacter mellowenesis TaxID=3063995 RepID=A0ABT9A9X2_9BACT|nr:pyridoxamine 5'-phosphate oxidase family protein [Hymenobacter sp. M29]MDO7845781.1 pyridoxamine 5'-phosphate oxidase family protein [Hymenobacter sp. M29]